MELGSRSCFLGILHHVFKDPFGHRHGNYLTVIYKRHHVYFPAQLVDGTLSDLLDKPWSQVSSLLPPGTCLLFLSRMWFSMHTARRLPSNFNSCSRAFR